MRYPKKYLYQRIVNAKQFIDEHYSKKINLSSIIRASYFSKYHFIRLFKKAYGLTPHQYLIKRRIEKAKIDLKTTEKSIQEICYSLSFESPPSFTNLFKKRTAQTPSQYRINCKNKALRGYQNPLSQIPGCYALIHES